ncbi:MAG: ricin-type beta-trefoil lectin domain protein [Burkholderiaceae bacterium]|nr:ricin-type beta-trefoil lectin domain protein [Burkholderiaceae bacterium]
MWSFLNHGFTDVWIQKVRNGQVPPIGNPLLCGTPEIASPTCEITDKALFRDNGYVGLKALKYIDHQDGVDASGVQLSDHHPIEVDWSYATTANRAMSDQWGGPHGTNYNDVASLPANPTVSTVNIQTGNRVDHVELALSNGDVFSHGGSGGSLHSMQLGSGEYLSSVNLCSGQYHGDTRIFSIDFATSAGRHLAGGTGTSSCTTYNAPAGWQIVGFHGRSGDEVDKLGVIYAPLSSATPDIPQPLRIVNASSGMCMDVSQAAMANGTIVDQWSCNGGANQQWSYDDSTGLIRSVQDPHYCLDHGSTYADGAQLMIWTCSGNYNQRFKFNASNGTISMRGYPAEVIDGSTAAGANLQTLTASGTAVQSWKMIP